MKKRKCKRTITIFTLLFFIFFVICLYYFNIVEPIIKTYTSAETSAITEKAVNLAVSNVINRTLSYDSLIDINYSSTGEIVSFSANQYEINSITREIIKESQYQITNMGKDSLGLNLGTFTGIPFFIGRGPKIHLKLVPIGTVAGKFDSEFDSVGINMTKHSLFLYIDVHVSIVMPVKNYEVYSTNQILLAESIIMGKVPEVYLSGGALNKTLNLIP